MAKRGQVKPTAMHPPEEAVQTVHANLLEVNRLNRELNAFMTGLRLAMEVPKTWRYDSGQAAFVPPEKKQK